MVYWYQQNGKLEGTLLSQVGQTCENQLDYYTALRKAGLGQYVPNQYKQRSPSSAHFNRYAQSQMKDWQQYTQIENS